MLHNLEHAANYPEMTKELAELLSIQRATVEHRVKIGVIID